MGDSLQLMAMFIRRQLSSEESELQSVLRRRPLGDRTNNSEPQRAVPRGKPNAKQAPASEPVAASAPICESAPGKSELPSSRIRYNPGACVLFSLWLAATIFYFYARYTSLPIGRSAAAAWLCVELGQFLLCQPIVLLNLIRSKVYRPVEDPHGRRLQRDFHARVLIPCYLESLELVRATATAALQAALPEGCQATVYVLDDGRDPAKKAWVQRVDSPRLKYITRSKPPGEINGKAGNLNNALRMLYRSNLESIPLTELVVVFDADMVCAPEFFLRTLQWMQHDTMTIVNTPHYFHNVDMAADVHAHSNIAFWHVVLCGLDAWDTIQCNGSNFVLRAKHAADVGFFPEYCMSEDLALALELQRKGFKGMHLQEKLAVGEAPPTVGAAFSQKSRWCEGGMSIFLRGRRSPLFCPGLSLFQRYIWQQGGLNYTYSTVTHLYSWLMPVLGAACLCFHNSADNLMRGWAPLATALLMLTSMAIELYTAC